MLWEDRPFFDLFYDVEFFDIKVMALWKFYKIWKTFRFLCLFFLKIKDMWQTYLFYVLNALSDITKF